MDSLVIKERLRQYQAYYPAAFFILGFLFDLFTLDRIDSIFQLSQQFVFLFVAGLLIILDIRYRNEVSLKEGVWAKCWSYRYELIHFILGSLLCAYVIFYFKSASLWNSLVFLSFLVGLTVLNELEIFKSLGDILRLSILSLCSCSYFIYLVPIIWRQVGFWTFIFSLVLSMIFLTLFFYGLLKSKEDSRALFFKAIGPAVAVHVLFLLLFLFSILPPVPVSIKKIGVYHSVEKVGGRYHLYYDRSWWRFWQSGAQDFVAEPGDQIVSFVSVFAPSFFKDQLRMEWWFQQQNEEWKKTDSIAMSIVGGRDYGYRGYSIKSNYTSGKWQVRVMTSDQREIGRIYFDVLKTEVQSQRSFAQDLY